MMFPDRGAHGSESLIRGQPPGLKSVPEKSRNYATGKKAINTLI
jgi:hypothetical protein